MSKTSSFSAIAQITEGITKKWLRDRGFPPRTWEAQRGKKSGLKRPANHRWLEDYTRVDIRHLPEEARDYLRIFILESVYNTFSSNPEYRIHKDFIKDGEIVGARRMEGYGIYRDYNITEKDLLSQILHPNPKNFVGRAFNVDEATDSNNEEREYDCDEICTSDLYPTSPSHEDKVIEYVDAQDWAEENGVELDVDEAGTSPKRMTTTITLANGSKVKVEAMTYLNVRGVLVKDVKALDGRRLWPDDREAATKALHEKRRQSQAKIVKKRSPESNPN